MSIYIKSEAEIAVMRQADILVAEVLKVVREHAGPGVSTLELDRLAEAGGTSGHAKMTAGYDYDSICTAIDTEIYKLVTFEMLVEAGVTVCVNIQG